ncbi:MAG: hypothetical protein QGG46_07890 [Gammaproteobacteria bacterium]|nr:hypothetical protein [Gammaproteobacteria bacterium]
MARFATWLAANRLRRVVFIAAFFPIIGLGLLSAATVVMDAQLRGPRDTAQDCLMALAILAGIALLTGSDVMLLGVSAALSWLLWLLLGSLAGRAGSLTLAVQAAVLLALVGMAVFIGLVDDPVAYWSEMLETAYANFAEQGFDVSGEVDVAAQAALMSGVVVAGSLTSSIVALLLGSSWASAVQGGSYGEQFRSLRLGYFIGGLAALAGLASIFGLQLSGLLLVFGAAFMFQGMAVTAWWSHRRNWPRGWWVGLCILPALLVDLAVVIGVLFAAIGFIDNWYGLRRSFDRT